MLYKKLSIFLSSTLVDLTVARKEIIKYLGVLPAEIVSMEIFGSDEAAPKDYCLSKVSESDIFIGIYAERYGYMDPETGLSMTELEYRQALKGYEAGLIRSILIYIVDEEAEWPLQFVERNLDASQKLRLLKTNIMERHVVTKFKRSMDLPFFVLRDVIKKVGVVDQIFSAKPAARITPRSSLNRPLGMESYKSDILSIFKGRDAEIDNVVKRVLVERFSLIIGDSGIGKTSLINAGLMPRLLEMGWRCIIIRPFYPLIESIKLTLWSDTMNGGAPLTLLLEDFVRSILDTHKDTTLVLVFDQFEDVLTSRIEPELPQLVRSLLSIQNQSIDRLRIVFSYRADREASLGPIWQTLSGTPGGLPRCYIGPMSAEATYLALKASMAALRKGGAIGHDQYDYPLEEDEISQDIWNESIANGFQGTFPPFLQMVISELCQSDKQDASHWAIGRSKRIVGDFLLDQIRLMGPWQNEGRLVLIALVSSYGNKTQKTLDEIASESRLTLCAAEHVVAKLVDLRLIRQIGAQYEIVHDFLARRVIVEVLSAEEIDAKKVKEFVASRSDMFAYTRTFIDVREYMHVYKYRSKVAFSDNEMIYLLQSGMANGGPIYAWATQLDSVLETWVSEQMTLYSLSADFGERDHIYAERNWATDSIETLAKSLDGNDPVVLRHASQQIIDRTDSLSDHVVATLSLSKTWVKRLVLAKIISKIASGRGDYNYNLKCLKKGRLAYRAVAAARILKSGDHDSAKMVFDIICDERTPKTLGFCLAFLVSSSGYLIDHPDYRVWSLLEKNNPAGEGLILGLERSPAQNLSRAVGILKEYFYVYPEQSPWVLSNIMQPVHLSIIRPIISPLSRPDIWHDGFLSQFVKISGADGLSLLLDCLRRTYYHIDIRYPENLIEEAAKVCTKYIIVYLEDIVKTRDFWNDFDDGAFPWESEGSQIKTVHLNHLICRDAENSPDAPSEFASLPRDHPPFTNENSNMYLLRWLVAGVFCRAAPASYKGILMELLFHRYWRVKQEALLGLERVLTSDDIDFVLTYLERRHSDIGWELLYLLDRKIYGCSLGASTLARIESIRRAHKLSEARMD